MSRYQFRLQTLRRLRENTRDERREKLSEAHLAEQILAERRVEVSLEIVELQQLQRQIIHDGAVDVTQLLEAQRYQASLEIQKKVMAEQSQTLDAEIQRRHNHLVEADREVRLLDKLDDKQRAEHRRERQRAETSQLDEIGSQRWQGGER